MSNNLVSKIRITKKVPLFGEGDTLESRLRKVSLRGFPDVKIYEQASLKLRRLSSEDVGRELHTPQPHVLRTNLDRVTTLARLFEEQGVDIYHLGAAYDYIAVSESGEETEWTILPPIVERFSVPAHTNGGFDYAGLIGDELRKVMTSNGWGVNPETTHFKRTAAEKFSLINDGSHRVHAGVESGKGITVLEVEDMVEGFPYYAIPQPYSSVKVFPTEEEAADLKVHVLTSPGHKQLYRLFPSGGILSGTVRAAREGESFV